MGKQSSSNQISKTEIVQMKPDYVQPNPANLLQLAVEKNVSVEQLEKLMALHTQWEANNARKTFFASLAKFQAEVPVIEKKKKVNFSSAKGTVSYIYATLDEIIKQIKTPLQECGLTYRWEIEDAESIKVTCMITHVDGHTEKTVMTAKPDDSGSKNAIQSRGSTVSYLQRYTLIGALGLATAQSDPDGEIPKGDPNKLPEHIQTQINESKTVSDLENVWNEHKSLHKNGIFKSAVTKRKSELK